MRSGTISAHVLTNHLPAARSVEGIWIAGPEPKACLLVSVP